MTAAASDSTAGKPALGSLHRELSLLHSAAPQLLQKACDIERRALGWTAEQRMAGLVSQMHAPEALATHLFMKGDLGLAASLMQEVLQAQVQALVCSCQKLLLTRQVIAMMCMVASSLLLGEGRVGGRVGVPMSISLSKARSVLGGV